MAFFEPFMAETHLNMVCRNTPHLSEFGDREENTMLIGYVRVSNVQKWAAKAGTK